MSPPSQVQVAHSFCFLRTTVAPTTTSIATGHTTMADFEDDDMEAMLAAEEAMEQEQMAMDAVRA